MSAYDADITIGTKVDTDGINKGAEKVNNESIKIGNSLSSRIGNAFKSINANLVSMNAKLGGMNSQIGAVNATSGKISDTFSLINAYMSTMMLIASTKLQASMENTKEKAGSLLTKLKESQIVSKILPIIMAKFGGVLQVAHGSLVKVAGTIGTIATTVLGAMKALLGVIAKIVGAVVLIGTAMLLVVGILLAGIIAVSMRAFSTMLKLNNYGESLRLKFDQLKLSMSMAFQPLVTIALPYIIQVVNWLINMFTIIQMVIAALTGQKTIMKAVATSSGGAADNSKKMADNTKKAGQAAENALASFDEINVLAQDTANAENIDPTGAGAGGGNGIKWEEVPVSSAVSEWVDGAKKNFADFLTWIWGGIASIGTNMGLLKIIWDAVWAELTAFAKQAWDNLIINAQLAWIIITYYWGVFASWFNENVWTPLLEKHPFEAIRNIADVVYKLILIGWIGFAKWFENNVFEPVKKGFMTAFENIQKNWGTLKKWFDDTVIIPLRIAFNEFIESVKTSFKSGFNDILAVSLGVVNRIIDSMNKKIQGMVSSINSLIGSVNAMGQMLPGWRNIPLIGAVTIPNVSIPKLASGAVIPPNGEFMAMLGDNKTQREILAPEDMIRQIVREESGSKEIVIRFEGSMSELVRILNPYLAEESKRTGTSFVFGG